MEADTRRPSPRRIHELHEQMQRLLVRGQAPGIALLLQARYLEVVLGLGSAVWAAYAFPVALSMLRRIHPEILDGFSPEQIDGIAAIVDRCASLPPAPWPGASEWPERLAASRLSLQQARRRLEALLRGGRGNADGMAIAFLGVKPASPSRCRILAPIVLVPAGAEGAEPLFADLQIGRILALSVEAEVLFSRADYPRLSIEGDAGRETREALEDAVGLLDRLPVRHGPAASRCWFRVRWDAPGGRLVGRSVVLPFLLAASCARSRLAAGVSECGLMEGIAVTGDLDGTRVRPVDLAGLRAKVEACFYSSVRTLFVPAEQRESALKTARSLERRHPGRQLVIEAVEEVAELWRNPAVVLTLSRRWREIAGAAVRRLAWSRAFVAGLAGVLILLAGVGARQIWLYRDRPQTAEWHGERLVVRNSSGHVCWMLHLPPGSNGPTGLDPTTGVWDLDGDGVNEVISMVRNPDFRPDRLCVWDCHGHPLWTLSSHDLLSPRDSLVQDVCWWFLLPIGTEESRPLCLLAVRRSTQHGLCLIDRIDGPSGRRLGVLWNDGHMERSSRVDLDGDGHPEICLCGQDNTTADALVSVIDPDRMRLPEKIEAGVAGGSAGDSSARALARDGAVARQLAAIPSLTSVVALRAGVITSLRFEMPRFAAAQRAACAEVTREEAGQVLFDITAGEPPLAVLVYIHFKDLMDPQVLRAVFTDASRSIVLGEDPPRWNEEDLAAEEARLGRSVRHLVAAGWEQVPVSPK